MRNWLALLLVSVALLYASALDPVLDLNLDSPRFVMLGRSIHDGQAYMGRFDLVDRPETQIPYLYPLILSGVIGVAGPDAYLAFKLVSVICAVLALWALWFWMSGWTTEIEARTIVIVAAFLTQMQAVSGRIATEAPFLAASFACMGFMERAVNSTTIRLRDWFPVIFLIGVCFHLRAAGWSLLGTFVVSLLWKKNWRVALAGGLLGLAACAPWLIRTIQLGLGYSAEFEQNTPGAFSVLYRMAYNSAADVAKALPDLFFYPFFASFVPYEPMFYLKALIGVSLFALMVHGLSSCLRKRKQLPELSVTTIYFVVYLAGALAWTVHGERYLLPVLPLLIWALLRGAGRWRAEAAVLLVTAGLTGCFSAIHEARTGMRSREEASLIEASLWVKNHVPKTEIVMSRYPTWIAALAGNRGIRWTETNDPTIHRQDLVRDHVGWVITDHIKVAKETGTERLAPFIHGDPDEFSLQFETLADPITRVYRFSPRPR